MTAYSVVPGASDGFALEVQSEGKVELVAGFKTAKGAEEWLVDQQKSARMVTIPLDLTSAATIERD